ncbi:MAG: UbiA family prenyltransferase [Gemmatimonadetes bacterium]|nr:UbiA family prenyltransferase [Gemmatimonadota bacterium]
MPAALRAVQTTEESRRLRSPCGFGSPAPVRPEPFLGAVQSVRPGDTAVAVLGTLVGAHLAQPVELALPSIGLAAAANGLLCAGSMAFNDWRDVREDAINKPKRPVVVGLIARETVLRIAAALFLLGVAAAWAIPAPRFGIAALLLVAASIGYTMRLKTVPLLGNAAVAIVTTYPLWCWLLTPISPSELYVPLCLAALSYRLGAEIIKTVEDRRGDQLSGVRTVATCYGARPTLLLGCACMIGAVLVAWWPAAAGGAGTRYLAWITVVTLLTLSAWAPRGRAGSADEAARGVVRRQRITITLAALGLALV